MKRLCSILVSVVLSVVIVYLGAGAVIVECLRSNTVSVGVSDDDCCKMGDKSGKDCCQCMKTMVVKLHPTTLCKQMVKAQPPVFAVAQRLFCDDIGASLRWKMSPNMLRAASVQHSPPRAYLAMIRVLII